jgi:hypothetical protein
MTEVELFTELQTLGLPVAYGEFSSPVEPPYISYHFVYSSDLFANDVNSIHVDNYQIEVYTRKKDPVTEAKVENLLTSLLLPYRKLELYTKEESPRLRQTIYDIQLTN